MSALTSACRPVTVCVFLVFSGFNCRIQKPRGPRDPPAEWSRLERWDSSTWFTVDCWTGLDVLDRMRALMSTVIFNCTDVSWPWGWMWSDFCSLNWTFIILMKTVINWWIYLWTAGSWWKPPSVFRNWLFLILLKIILHFFYVHVWKKLK